MRAYLAELVGTFVLVFGGCGSAVLAGDSIGSLGVAIAFGLSLLTMFYAIGPISGCHVNPAVTAGFLVAGRMDASEAAGYVIAQVMGGIIGAGAVLFIAWGSPMGYDAATQGLAANGYGVHSPAGYDMIAALLTEVILTFVMVFTVLTVTTASTPPQLAGVAIGFALALIHLVGIPVTNTSVNPARSIGPAVFVGGWALEQLWLFLVAPLIGSVCAALLYQLVYPRDSAIAMRAD
ncbi:MAG TPA: aquaporin Z [Steroidobacteraceae bacterium]|jgi:aquaporin Z|nr:aquaporin Z [Steroidobacteraceae bacterium]